MTNTPKAKPKKTRTQQSMWLMLGGAMLLSLAGFAVIADQSMPPVATAVDSTAIQVVELPTAVAQTNVVTRPSVAQSAPSVNNLRRVTRPVMRSRSSN